MYGKSCYLPNILIWAESQEPILYEDVRFFICASECHISLNVTCGKIPSRLNGREKEYFIRYYNLNDRKVDFCNSKLINTSSTQYEIPIR